MKKYFSLCLLTLLTGLAVQAQDDVDTRFQFQDANGNVVPNGSVITVTKTELVNDELVMSVPLYIKNVAGEQTAGSLYEELSGLPNGTFQSCAFGNCKAYEQIIADGNYGAKSIVQDGVVQDIETEWLPEEGKYASWTATFQIHVFDIEMKMYGFMTVPVAGSTLLGQGPKVTVNFVYADPDGISDAANEQAQPRQYYSLDGRQLCGEQRGLQLVRLSNGKTIKKITR